jgi:AcrR family transcriptional regulator
MPAARRPKAPSSDPPRARKARGLGHERPDEILAAAKEMFLAEGYERVTTRALAARVGLSQTGLYVYFKTKEEILDALCQRTYQETLEDLRRIEAEIPDDLERFRAMARAIIESGLRAPKEYQIIYMTPRRLLHGPEDAHGPREQMSRGIQIVLWQQDLVGRLIDAGVFRRAKRVVVTQVALATIHGLISRMVAWPDFPWPDREELIEAHIETLILGLKAPSARGK